METSLQNDKIETPEFLSGGGEMGQLIRDRDWSKTPLGDPKGWPQSLRTMVSVMLDNPFGMYIAWGSEYTQLYNDGYRPILGSTKHPQALGIGTRETFSEIWHIIESMFDGVMKGKAVGFPDLMLPLNRNGFVEECFFDFSYSPIRKEDGKIGGVLVTVIETTDKKKAQAELLENTNQLKFAIDAAELGTWDYDPSTNKFTANERLRKWFGLSASEEIELHHATDAIAEKDRDRIILAIEKTLDYSSGGIYEEEYSIINPVTKNEIIVHGKGRAWFNDEKIAYRFNGILQEVTENVLARKKIEDSEEQLRIAIEGGEFGTFDFTPKANQLIWSGKTKELFGLPPDASVDYETYIAALHPEDRGTSRAIALQQANLKDGGLYELEYRTIGITDGKLRWLRSKGKATYNKDGEAIRYTGVIQDITKQKEAAEILLQSNKRFRDTVMQAPVGICILRGPQYIVEMANDAYLQLVDKKEAEFVGSPLFDTLPEVEESVHALLDNVLNNGIPHHGNEVAIPLNRYGKLDVFYFDFLYHPLKEEDGKISGVIAIVTEVTEKVEARKKTEQNEQRLNIVLEASELGTYELNLKTNEPTYSKRYLEILGGYKDDTKLTHSQLLKHLHPDDLAVREKAFKDAFLTGYLHYEARLIWNDKSIHWMEGKGKIFYDKENNPEILIGTIRDITEEKNHEQELKESEYKFRLLADSMPQHIWTSDTEGNLNYYNYSVFAYSGLTQEQINKDGWIQIVHPDDREENIKQWINSITTGEDFLFEHRFRRHDGEYRWQLSRAIPQRDVSGKIQMWVGTSTDIHDKKSVEVQLDKLVIERTTQLERSNEDLQQFAHVASHDLKEPVRKIMTFCNRLIDEFDEDIPARGKEYIEKIQRASKRMTAMIEGVLTYSSLNAMEQIIEPVDLNDTITNIVSDLEVIIQKKGANIRMENLPTIDGADVLIYQLFYNLINNSLKFSKATEAPVIDIRSSFTINNSREMACITVTDNGIGFQNESSEKIFNTFARLNSKDKYEGTGLGLALCKKIVERHNGFIKAEGEKDSGATFTILLPLKQQTRNI